MYLAGLFVCLFSTLHFHTACNVLHYCPKQNLLIANKAVITKSVIHQGLVNSMKF